MALTPGWMRSEMMLEAFGVTEANWRDAAAAQPHFAAISESPRFVGRAVAALAADPGVLAAAAVPIPRAAWPATTASLTSMAPGPTAGGIWWKSRRPACRRPRRVPLTRRSHRRNEMATAPGMSEIEDTACP